jgi:Ca2+/Na+ antiporter
MCNPLKTRAEIRGDLIRRLFAVAISIGLATSLTQMGWVSSGTWPTLKDWNQLSILGTGLILTVLSWDGYLASIEAKPLHGDWSWRFFIDISLVLIYLLFMLTSQVSHYWPFILMVTFILYVVWDFLTVREYVGSYDAELKPSAPEDSHKASIHKVLQIYYRGFRRCQNTSQGPVITLSWAIFFVLFAGVYYYQQITPWIGCIAASTGLIIYRRQKCKNSYHRNYKIFSILWHILHVSIILISLEVLVILERYFTCSAR